MNGEQARICMQSWPDVLDEHAASVFVTEKPFYSEDRGSTFMQNTGKFLHGVTSLKTILHTSTYYINQWVKTAKPHLEMSEVHAEMVLSFCFLPCLLFTGQEFGVMYPLPSPLSSQSFKWQVIFWFWTVC
jgi:hypothetical protein